MPQSGRAPRRAATRSACGTGCSSSPAATWPTRRRRRRRRAPRSPATSLGAVDGGRGQRGAPAPGWTTCGPRWTGCVAGLPAPDAGRAGAAVGRPRVHHPGQRHRGHRHARRRHAAGRRRAGAGRRGGRCGVRGLQSLGEPAGTVDGGRPGGGQPARRAASTRSARGDALLTPGAFRRTDAARRAGWPATRWPTCRPTLILHVGSAAVPVRVRPLGDGHRSGCGWPGRCRCASATGRCCATRAGAAWPAGCGCWTSTRRRCAGAGPPPPGPPSWPHWTAGRTWPASCAGAGLVRAAALRADGRARAGRGGAGRGVAGRPRPRGAAGGRRWRRRWRRTRPRTRWSTGCRWRRRGSGWGCRTPASSLPSSPTRPEPTRPPRPRPGWGWWCGTGGSRPRPPTRCRPSCGRRWTRSGRTWPRPRTPPRRPTGWPSWASAAASWPPRSGPAPCCGWPTGSPAARRRRPGGRVLAGLPQPFTLSEARRALGTTRRVAVPLLELLDRRGLTERLPDDRRRLRAGRPGAGHD